MATAPTDFEDLEDEGDFALERRELEDSEMDITPMIDITFLLLIFFIVASKMEESASVDLPNASTGNHIMEDDSLSIIITKGDGDMATVSINDEEVGASSPEEQEEKIEAIIAENVKPPGEEGLHEVLIKAEKNVKHGEVNRIELVVSRAAEHIQILHVAVMEAQ